jgi:hypothetical protein
MEPGALVGAAAAALVVVALVAVLLLARAGRSARARRDALAAELARSRADVEALSSRVTDLADELQETRRVAAADREYVITSLGGDAASGESTVVDALLLQPSGPARPRLGRLLEDRLVGSLSRRGGSRGPGRISDVVVRAVALGHGVRRALSPDILDRAAAESQVARRRSRRTRRKELRDARRLLRSVKAQDVA